MNVLEDVKSVVKKLKNKDVTKNAEQVVDLLKHLEGVPISVKILTRTRLGIIVNEVRKSSDNKEVKDLSKSLIKRWKKQILGPKNDAKQSSTKSKTKEKKDKEKLKQSKPTVSDGDKTRPDELKEDKTHLIRLKCKDMLLSALKTDVNVLLEALENLAKKLEETIFSEFGTTCEKYKNRIRSRVMNLKDPKNPHLRDRFVRGEISVSEMATMSSSDMATEEMNNAKKAFFSFPKAGEV